VLCRSSPKMSFPMLPCMSLLVICHLSLGANIYIVSLQRFNVQKQRVRRRLVRTLIVSHMSEFEFSNTLTWLMIVPQECSCWKVRRVRGLI
jgi:hypothetical protein